MLSCINVTLIINHSLAMSWLGINSKQVHIIHTLPVDKQRSNTPYRRSLFAGYGRIDEPNHYLYSFNLQKIRLVLNFTTFSSYSILLKFRRVTCNIVVTTDKTPTEDIEATLEHLGNMAKKLILLINNGNDTRTNVTGSYKYIPVIKYYPSSKQVRFLYIFL